MYCTKKSVITHLSRNGDRVRNVNYLHYPLETNHAPLENTHCNLGSFHGIMDVIVGEKENSYIEEAEQWKCQT